MIEYLFNTQKSFFSVFKIVASRIEFRCDKYFYVVKCSILHVQKIFIRDAHGARIFLPIAIPLLT